MSNEFYTKTGAPATGSTGASAVVRSEYASIEAAFDKLPTMNGAGALPVFVNAGGTALESTAVATARTRLGLSIGNNVQAFNNELSGLATLNNNGTFGAVVRTANGAYTTRTIVAGNGITVSNGNGVAGNIVINANAVSLTPLNNSLAADVNLTNSAAFFDGPIIAQGSNGTWLALGTVTVIGTDTVNNANFSMKLWDGTTVISSTALDGVPPSTHSTIALSGFITAPSGNLRISVKESAGAGQITFNSTGLAKDSTITAIRIEG